MNAAQTIRVNGEDRSLAEGTTLLALVAELTGHDLRDDGSRADGGRLGVAAAVGGSVVARSRWAGRALAAGDQVEIVTAVQGG